ncbi:hypothetical protein [Flavobacterium sp.]|uniref:hypothetical protein n=1 Tax=Flavobacterium sp. TaxID=239 RepID=UPI0039E27AB1
MWAALCQMNLRKASVMGTILSVLVAYLLFPNYFELVIDPVVYQKNPWQTLDLSWSLALNYADLQGLEWGRDFIFTYGPLGNYCTRIGWGQGRFWFVALDLFTALNYFWLVYGSFRDSQNKLQTALVIGTTAIIIPFWVGAPQSMVYLFFLVFWICRSLDRPLPQYYWFQIGLISLVFFIKFNTGLLVFVLYFMGLLYNVVSRQINGRLALAYAALPLVLIAVGARLLNVALVPYITSGIELVSGYNAIMYFDTILPRLSYYAGAMALLLVAVLGFCLGTKRQPLAKIPVLALLFLIPLFVLYKQAFVRADAGHLVDFFYFTPLLVLCFADLHSGKSYWTLPLLAAALWIPFQVILFEMKYPLGFAQKLDKSQYWSQLVAHQPDSGFRTNEANLKLPPHIIQTIGTKTIDVYPWDIRLLFDNGLHYLPRPICQSYTAYTPYLEQRNFDHYNGPKAPEYVLYEYLSTDNRYALFDEAKVNLALSRNYLLETAFEFDGRKFLLLHKKKDFKPLYLEPSGVYEMNLSGRLVPEKDRYYEIGLSHSLAGLLVSAADHAPELQLEIKVRDEPARGYRTSLPLLQAGVFSDSFVNDTTEAALFLGQSEGNRKVDYYAFKPVQANRFCDKIKVKVYRIRQ